MSTINSPIYKKLAQKLKEARVKAGLQQSKLASLLKVTQSYVSKVERNEIALDLGQLREWCDTLDINPTELLLDIGFLRKSDSLVSDEVNVAVPIGAEATADGSGVLVEMRLGKKTYKVRLDDCLLTDYLELVAEVSRQFEELNIKAGLKNRDVIASAIQLSVNSLPRANPSDLYHHIVYRLYVKNYRRSDPAQSWVRAGGEGVELFIKHQYATALDAAGVKLMLAFEMGEKNRFLKDMRIDHLVPGSSKLDIGLYGEHDGCLVPFGGIHVKASLAERVSDDKPCSEIMMKQGYSSFLFTFDAKSFPPPNGDLINRGELGSPQSPSDKRKYIEENGSFDACFSYNLRTTASPPTTKSGKKIYSSRFGDNDPMVREIVAAWEVFKKQL